ncbi:hypothetical protein NP511_02745 [Natrinema thermotolerans]|uniref:DUF7992 domain-containing protein n=1 Tax=Natrinema thermotolerans TaxID=121872 RepID=A0AAF0PFJ9_9EURY|nr:hypothetical protein [Natrinema thermotolerans]ELZ15025.1 hypothetical protein C478_05744 [Natrinema thermotolerans DSM 11552]QCC57484.1 hypothetical protein DVR14_02030 [Natrinema thermotolerans]WMT08559.1 hypothetical protein NP511_02745 [Natrinema thermotolerans]
MSLDVEVPDPPSLHGSQHLGDYDAVEEPDERTGDNVRREALADFLEGGAWEDAFSQWARETSLTDREFRLVREYGLFDAFDFYWNQSAEDVGYRVPSVPTDAVAAHDDLDDVDIETIEEELESLGWIVSEVLETDYIHRDGEEFGYTWE